MKFFLGFLLLICLAPLAYVEVTGKELGPHIHYGPIYTFGIYYFGFFSGCLYRSLSSNIIDIKSER